MVAVIGHLTVDDIVLPDGRTAFATPGGNALYAALGARLWGVRTCVITCRTKGYPGTVWAQLVRLSELDWGGVVDIDTTTLRQWALYDVEGGRSYLPLAGSPGYEDISPRPEQFSGLNWGLIDAVHIAPMPLGVVETWVRWLRERWAHLYIQVDPHHDEIRGRGSVWRRILPQIDGFMPSDLEADMLEQEGLDSATMCALLEVSEASALVVKHGANGSQIFARDRVISMPAVSVSAVDPTGCGDAYAGGFLAGVACRRRIRERAAWGSVSASFALEAYGPRRLWQTELEEARARWRALSSTRIRS